MDKNITINFSYPEITAVKTALMLALDNNKKTIKTVEHYNFHNEFHDQRETAKTYKKIYKKLDRTEKWGEGLKREFEKDNLLNLIVDDETFEEIFSRPPKNQNELNRFRESVIRSIEDLINWDELYNLAKKKMEIMCAECAYNKSTFPDQFICRLNSIIKDAPVQCEDYKKKIGE